MEKAFAMQEKLQQAIGSRAYLSVRHRGIIQVVSLYISAVFIILGCVMVITILFTGQLTDPDVLLFLFSAILFIFTGVLFFVAHRILARSEEMAISAHLRQQAEQTQNYKKSLLPLQLPKNHEDFA